MRFSLDKKLIESLINYLATKPYSEVNSLIMAIQNDIKPIEEKEDASRQ